MKQVLFSFLLLNVVFLSGCSTAQTAAKTKTDSKTEASEKPKKETFTGDYQSSKGVMTPLSCYCNDGGTLTVSEDEKIKVCFDGMKEKPGSCQRISITGHYETLANEPEETSPCERGTMQVFVVEKFKCK